MPILNDSAKEIIRKSSVWISNLRDAYLKVGYGDSANIDAFGRLRVSAPIEILGNKNLYSGNEHLWHKKTAGGGAISYLSQESAVQLSVGTAQGDLAIRQSRPNLYIPGKSQLINITGVFGADKKDGSVRRAGYFDGENGVFLEVDGSDVYFVVRSDVSGSVVDTKILQKDWNKDTYSSLDLTKTQILTFTFQWLGVGKVDFFLTNPDGSLRLCHREEHANLLSTVYMRSPTLPIRFEIYNKTATTGSSYIKEICSNVSSEGGESRIGYNFAIGGGARTATAGVGPVPIIALRLKNTFNTKKNRVLVQVKSGELFSKTGNVIFFLNRVSEPATVTGTWISVSTRSACEYSADISAFTGTESVIAATSFVTASALGSNIRSASAPVTAGETNDHSFISQNIDSNNSEMFVVTALPTDDSTDVAVGIQFTEFH